MLPRPTAAAFLLAASLIAAPAFADQIIKTDGRRLDGRVVAENKDFVTFETSVGGMTLRQKVSRSQIKSIERPVREGPGYCPLPIVGVIGEDVLARDVEAGIREARRSDPKFIVLVIDSPGGVIDDMNRIVGVIAANPDLKFVAYVKNRAISAAAIIALACPQIYMAPEASIGACVPYGIGPRGTPVAVEEKWESAIRAQMRAAAKLGRHDQLWVRAMTELDAEVAAMPTADGKLAIIDKANAPDDARIVKRNGQILTITGTEAAELGLAAGVAEKLDDVKFLLGYKAWHVSDDSDAWRLMEGRARSARAEANRRNEKMQKELARREFYESATPEVRRLDDQITKALARCMAAEVELKSLKKEYDEKVARLDAEREQAVRTSMSVQTSARANDSFRVRRYELAQEYKPRVQELATRLREAAAEVDVLIERRKMLLAAAPTTE